MKINKDEEINKFLFELKSISKKKQYGEVIEKLRYEFPYKVEKDNIFIEKTNKKGFYNIYITAEKIHKHSSKRICILLVILFLITIICFCIINNEIKKIKYEKTLQIENEKNNLQKIEQQQQDEIKLNELKYEYNELFYNQLDEIYPQLEIIYSVLTENSFIENLYIEKNTFSLGIITKDAIQIFENFENHKLLSNVKMTRTTITGDEEVVTYIGNFIKQQIKHETNLNIKESISYFEREISLMKEKLEKQSSLKLSEYIKYIRELAIKLNCNEKYIQLKGEKDNIEVEYMLGGNIQDILRFIKEIQNSNNNLYDIKSIGIRNNNTSQSQATIIFSTGISIIEKTFHEIGDYDTITVEELSKYFEKENQINTVKEEIYEPKQEIIKETNEKLEELLYVGMVKQNNQTIILAKNEKLNTIYKVPLVDVEKNYDCCIEQNGVYIVKFRNVKYEVKK